MKEDEGAAGQVEEEGDVDAFELRVSTLSFPFSMTGLFFSSFSRCLAGGGEARGDWVGKKGKTEDAVAGLKFSKDPPVHNPLPVEAPEASATLNGDAAMREVVGVTPMELGAGPLVAKGEAKESGVPTEWGVEAISSALVVSVTCPHPSSLSLLLRCGPGGRTSKAGTEEHVVGPGGEGGVCREDPKKVDDVERPNTEAGACKDCDALPNIDGRAGALVVPLHFGKAGA